MNDIKQTHDLCMDLLNTVNEHDLSLHQSYVAAAYLTVVLARSRNLPLDHVFETMRNGYEVDKALDVSVQ